MFCLQDLNDGSELEALLCGHVSHSHCITDFLKVTGKQKEESCPLKCHQTSVLPQLEQEEVVDQEEVVVTVPEEAPDSEGEEAINRIVWSNVWSGARQKRTLPIS